MSSFNLKNPKFNDNDNENNQSYYSLHSKDNYKEKLETNIEEIICKYIKLVIEYLFFITENIGIKNTKHNNFLIERGLTTITHVFTKLLFYSNNLDLSYYHSQKSFYFYVEFIGQISEDQHFFLQLSSRDACIFVYKKTIFEVPSEFIKKSEISNNSEIKLKTLEIFDLYKYIINLLTRKMINYKNFNSYNEDKDNKQYFNEYFKNKEKIIKKLIHSNLNQKHLNNVIYFIQNIENIENVNNMNSFFLILIQFINKYLKKKEKIIDFEYKFNYLYLSEKLNENKYSLQKFIEILLEE
jgi:hypothetical protein